jgi:hypothetical protein
MDTAVGMTFISRASKERYVTLKIYVKQLLEMTFKHVMCGIIKCAETVNI